ncbi:MAG: flagellar M-ring protein FliF [Gammaproteobacteria bacterium]|nr:flagellar M-ring protein FliF [Gammaproteobacteria bacterium]
MENNAVIESPVVPVSNLNLSGVLAIPAVRQLLLLVGVAASVAVGFAVVLWSQSPVFTQLYSDLDTADAAQVAEALRGAGIEYKLDTGSGIVLVAESRLHDARLELATQGLPQGGSAGMDMLQDMSSFGVSQFMEGARYQHALEAELAETISHIGAIRSARVHLATPKQSAFIRDKNSGSASVLLELYRGRELEPDQASAIVHLIAASVSNVSASDVTLIDQNGRMLSAAGSQMADAQVSSQFKHAERLEESYKRRIEDLLTPLLGPGRVKAEVAAKLDFTVTEETRESFDPTRSVVRSEQINEQERQGGGAASQGVPGALSNQPPEAGADSQAGTTETKTVSNSTRSSTRNFEIDRTISRVQPQQGRIEKLSVAVLVDDSPLDGTVDGPPALTDADIEQYTALVKEAVGFDELRGDSVVVMKAAFMALPEGPAAEEPKIWEKPMLQNAFKQVLGVALVLALAFGLVRPMLRGLLSGNAVGGGYVEGGRALLGAGAAAAAGGQLAISAPSFDDKVNAAKNITGHDPARVAQIVSKWVTADE